MLAVNNTPSSGSGTWSFDVLQTKPAAAARTGADGSPGDRTVIGSSCRISGELQLSGTAQIEAAVEGQILSEGELIIGEAAEIRAAVYGAKVAVFGRVVGDITCSERLELFSGARVSGNICTPRLVIHDGVVFDGSCRMETGEPVNG